MYFLPEEWNETGVSLAEFFIFWSIKNKFIHYDDWLLFLLQGAWVQTVLSFLGPVLWPAWSQWWIYANF